MSVIFSTGGVGRLAEIKPCDNTSNDCPADRRSQLFIRVRTLPLRALHDLLYR